MKRYVKAKITGKTGFQFKRRFYEQVIHEDSMVRGQILNFIKEGKNE